jgi:hypothetical protein
MARAKPILYYSNEQSLRLFKKQREKELENEIKQLTKNEAIRNNTFYNENEAESLAKLYKKTMEKVDELKKQPKVLSTEENIKRLIKEKMKEKKLLALTEGDETLKLLLEGLPIRERQQLLSEQVPSEQVSSILALPPSEQVSSILALPPSEKTKPTRLTVPITVPERTATGELTPVGQIAEDAKIRVELRGNPIYEEIRGIERAQRSETAGLPKKALLKEKADLYNLPFDNSKNIKENINDMIRFLYKNIDTIKPINRNTEGQGIKIKKIRFAKKK